jgi:plasmid stabilization system protein ParE
MTCTIRFLPEIERDLIIGYRWYESKNVGLGEEFLRLFYTFANEISHEPMLYPRVYNEFRRRLMRRFPYAIYFRIEDRQIIIFGLFHSARDPRAIKRNLKKRD